MPTTLSWCVEKGWPCHFTQKRCREHSDIIILVHAAIIHAPGRVHEESRAIVVLCLEVLDLLLVDVELVNYVGHLVLQHL